MKDSNPQQPAAPVVHLRLWSAFSMDKSILSVEEAVAVARDDGMPALAVTDRQNCFAAWRFSQAAMRAGVQPILGLDAVVWSPVQNAARFSRLVLLCQNETGWRNLSRLLSRARLENQHLYQCAIAREWLTPEMCQGLIALCGNVEGDIGQRLLDGDAAGAEALARDWSARFPGSFYLEVQRVGAPGQEDVNRGLVGLAANLSLPLVATHAPAFARPGGAETCEARVCIHRNGKLDADRPPEIDPRQYLLSQDEMRALFHDLPEALANTAAIARRCAFAVTRHAPRVPAFAVPEGETADSFLARLAREGYEKRLPHVAPGSADDAVYRQRARRELEVIRQKGFSAYFLVVQDFVRWAKQTGIPVGPGRGSGAGSLVAFLLGITEVDPVRHDLLFERFLNPERDGLPDLDIDFCATRRAEVIDYLKKKYGDARVAQIGTVNLFGARGAIRKTARALALPDELADRLARLVPDNNDARLARLLEENPRFRQLAAEDPRAGRALEIAARLEGLPDNFGTHASGVVVAPAALSGFVPLTLNSDQDTVLTQWDKDAVDDVGLTKFDLLSLNTLTVIDLARQTALNMGQPVPDDLQAAALRDPETLRLIRDANTTGIFQLESQGMRALIRRLRPDRFEDVVALVAMYRPGPLDSGMADEFVRRKLGGAAAAAHPLLEEVLADTYGTILYQEQVMQIAQRLAGYSAGEADGLRRAVAKKKADEMAGHRSRFVAGAAAKGVAADVAAAIFDDMEKFAAYGFNKSHAVAYAMLLMQCAWLKARRPTAYMAAALNRLLDSDNAADAKKIPLYIDDARDNGIAFLLPDINASDAGFTVAEDKVVQIGLWAVKGASRKAVESVLMARSAGPFRDIGDFCRRVHLREVRQKCVESWIRVGAFDRLHPNRASLLAGVEAVIRDASAAPPLGPHTLYGPSEPPPPALAAVADWPEETRWQNVAEALGCGLRNPVLSEVRGVIEALRQAPLDALAAPCRSVRVCGMVNRVFYHNTGAREMAFVTLRDDTGQYDLTVFSELLARKRALLKEGQLLVAEVAVKEMKKKSGGEGETEPRAHAVALYGLAEACARFGASLWLTLGDAEADRLAGSLPALLADALRDHPGRTPVVVSYRGDHVRCDMELDAPGVAVGEPLLRRLAQGLPGAAVGLRVRAARASRRKPS